MVEYALKFCTLAAERQWNEPALKAAFQRDLNHNILTELACLDEEAMLDKLIDMSIQIDNLLQDQKVSLNRLPTPQLSAPEPMQLSNMCLSP